MNTEVRPAGNSLARRWSRALLCGPVAFAASVAVMAGGAVWIPRGAADIDNLVLPIVLFPAIWAALFFYSVLDRKLARAWGVILALLGVNGVMIGMRFVSAGSST